MSNLFTIAKELILSKMSLEELSTLPYTISYVLRKQIQVNSFNELPEEKRPPDRIIWWGTAEELEQWVKRVIYNTQTSQTISISENEVE